MGNEIRNAMITDTKLGEEHGCLTAQVFVEGDGWGCAFGGYSLDHWDRKPGSYSSADGYGAIVELMKTLDVDRWEDLKGKCVRVHFEGNQIVEIGHLLKKQWFSFKEYFRAVAEAHNG